MKHSRLILYLMMKALSLKAFSFISGAQQEFLLLPHLLNIVLKILSKVIRQKMK